MKRSRRALLVACAVVALCGHVAFWYLPRERTATVDASSTAGELFVSGGQEVRAWVAYPHQNLGAAARGLDNPAAAFTAAARLAGLGRVDVPSFGPFALPPSRALTIAVDPGGENLALAVEVYPTVALIARVAGLVAGNPVLRGGVVTLSGRRVRVGWRGLTWSVVEEGAGRRTPPATASGRLEQEHPAVAGLAFVAIDRRQGAVGPGTYRLRRQGRDLILASSAREDWSSMAELAEEAARRENLAFLGVRVEPSSSSVLLLPRAGGSGLRLPDAAVAWVGAGERWSLPGERILRLLGLDPVEGRVGGWGLMAMDEASLEVATRVAPVLGEGALGAGVALAIWVRPRDYLPLVAAIAEVLDALPIAPEDEVERWRDLEALLLALGPIERVRATLGPSGGEARLGWGER